MSIGICHALWCRKRCPGSRLMCKHHWKLVPENLRQAFYMAEKMALKARVMTVELRTALSDVVRSVMFTEGYDETTGQKKSPAQLVTDDLHEYNELLDDITKTGRMDL